jgi:hypothetical protein
MALFLLAHARTCDARLLDSLAHTAHTQPTALVGPVQTALWRGQFAQVLPEGSLHRSYQSLTAATRVQPAEVIVAHFTRVWSQHATSSTHDPQTYMSHA